MCTRNGGSTDPETNDTAAVAASDPEPGELGGSRQKRWSRLKNQRSPYVCEGEIWNS